MSILRKTCNQTLLKQRCPIKIRPAYLMPHGIHHECDVIDEGVKEYLAVYPEITESLLITWRIMVLKIIIKHLMVYSLI